jgi:hypothetical protein
MATDDTERQIQQLRDTLASYGETLTTDHLYELSRYLLDEIVERVSRLDSKAGRFASFSGAILALLLSTYSTWRERIGSSQLLLSLVGLAVVCVALAGWYAFRAMQVTNFEWISDRPIVFPSELLDFPDELKRYHILAIYRSLLSHQSVSEQKARRVIVSQYFFLGGAALFAVCLLGILVKPFAISLLGSLCYRLPGRNP